MEVTSQNIPEKFLHKEIFLLRISGLALDGSDNFKYKMYSMVMRFLFYTYPFVQLTGALLHPDEVDSDTIYCLFGIYLAIARISVFLRRRGHIRKTLLKLSEKPFTIDLERGGEAEVKLFEECTWITRAQTTVYMVCLFCSLYGTGGYTLIKRITSSNYKNWKLPFGKILFFNATSSPNYEMVWIYQMVSISLLCFSVTAIDLITAFVFCYVCYQFKFLQNSLRRIVKHSYQKMPKGTSLSIECKDYGGECSEIPWKYLQKSLKETVRYHLEIIAIASEMEQAFSLLFLLIIFYTTIILCFMIYRLSTIPINNPDVIPIIIEIVIYCVQVALLCFWGEQVTSESQEVAIAAYNAKFVGTDVRLQKGLALIIQRSQSPIKITAAKLTDIRLATFVGIMRAAYSSFMLLRSLNGNQSL